MQSNTIQPVNATPQDANAGFSADFDFAEVEVVSEYAGLAPGAPARIAPRALAIDRAAARLMRCGRCNKPGLTAEPMHSASDEYVVVVRCGRLGCGHHELA